MTLEVNVTVEELAREGKGCNWEMHRPKICPVCSHSKIWGHGYAGFFVSQLKEALFLKLYRCLGCKAILRLKPFGFFRKYQSSIQKIFEVLHCRVSQRCWPLAYPRQRAGHWLRKFIRKVQMDLPPQFQNTSSPLAEILEFFFQKTIPFLLN